MIRTSILDYKERGNDGCNAYQGNCSGRLIEDLLEHFMPPHIRDYMCGSGTTKDVAERLGVVYTCKDLNRRFDLVNDDIQERSLFTFWHPPYWKIITYAGKQYSADKIMQEYGFDPRERCLSRNQSWEDFVREMNYCMLKQFSALDPGGRMAVLVGDIKRAGRLYSMITELVKPGTIENILIKMQNNCSSDRTEYKGTFIPIHHEYLLILKKEDPLIFNLLYSVSKNADIRDLESPTWADVIHAVMSESKSPMTLDAIYTRIEGHKRTRTNQNWKAKVRQTLQISNYFERVQRGVWKVKKGTVAA